MNIEKFTMKTPDGIHANVEALKALFPEIVSEGKVDFEQLKTILGGEIADDERYQFTWAGKREAMLEASTPTTKTLRPCVEESKDWENTKNLYIEGDNLEALKILQNTYGGKVKMVYIDPPYNTGHDFIYHDNFHGTRQEELIKEGVVDAETGERFKMNSESNGHFHSDWCSMMYPRLKLARNLLREDGVLFMSIDDNEVVNARKLCDEVFGEGNFVAQLIWERAYAPKNDARFISNSHDYVLMVAKDISSFVIGRLPRTEEANARYRNLDNDPRGDWKPSDMSVKTYNAECDYPITLPSGRVVEPPTGRCWSLSKKAFLERLEDNRIWFGADGNSVPCIKRFLTELKFDGMAPTSIMFYKDVGHSQEGAKEVTALLEAGAFDGPKPARLLYRLLILAKTSSDSIILDFFSGSATTAHAVMKLNAEDGGNRKFIMVQLSEQCAEGSEAAKAGYKNICEIGKVRIRRAGEKIREELVSKDAKSAKSGETLFGQDLHDLQDGGNLVNPVNPVKTNLDIGFRVFKVDSSNMDDIYFQPMNVQQQDLIRAINNVKTDRTALDLLFGCLLEWGLPIDLPVKERKDLGSNTFEVDNGRIIAAFDSNITESTVRSIANEQPDFAIFRDQCFYDSASKINVSEIFKTLSPNTKLKVL